MKKEFTSYIKKFLSCTAHGISSSSNLEADLDVREEYANAFRTESYDEFWARVIALSKKKSHARKPVESTTAARLPSYRLFAEQLLDPDQHTVTQILALAHLNPTTHALLSEYFSETANASIHYSHLLKESDHARIKYKLVKATLESITTVNNRSLSQNPAVLTRLAEFSNSWNPFVSSALSPTGVRPIQARCSELLKRLERSREKVQARLRLTNKIKRGSGLLLVGLTASLTAVMLAHSVALLVATPGLIMVSLQLVSPRKLVKLSAQLDSAAKGTYILNRDFETISRLVARLKDEVEHMRGMAKFWLERGKDKIQASGEVAQQLRKNDCSFGEQLDELEEHLYLCFMTINRARNLVLRQVMPSVHST